MGFMNKLNKMKSFLFDEEDEKEVRKPSKKNHKKEEKIEGKKEEKLETKEIENVEELYFEDVSEEELSSGMNVQSRTEKNEQTFKFPEFDEDDFVVSSKRPESIIPVQKEEPKRMLYQGSKRKEETKKFKPSPIISPIYGLLDKEGNTIKEESSSSEKVSTYNDEVTFDEVRKKAYGTLDEEIENTMRRLSKKTIEEAEKDLEMENKELSRTSKKSTNIKSVPSIISLKEELEDDDDDMILPNVDFKEIDIDKEKEKVSNKKSSKKEIVKQESYDDDDDDDTKEQDLFNLIDTMYQNKEDED